MSSPVPSVINLREKFSLFDDLWSPKVVAELNDVQFKLAKVQGDFVWHSHETTDEAFLVIDGELEIDLRDSARPTDVTTLTITSGEMIVVPRGHEHRPRAAETCLIMILEPRGIVNTGDQTGPLTAPLDQWLR